MARLGCHSAVNGSGVFFLIVQSPKRCWSNQHFQRCYLNRKKHHWYHWISVAQVIQFLSAASGSNPSKGDSSLKEQKTTLQKLNNSFKKTCLPLKETSISFPWDLKIGLWLFCLLMLQISVKITSIINDGNVRKRVEVALV